MNIDAPLALLGGLTPQQFMQRHWQKRPLLVRKAIVDPAAPLAPRELFALATHDDVESRLVVRRGADWELRRGPMPRRALPPLTQGGWTLLVQGVDLHSRAAHELLQRFRFVPDARVDDLMISFASDGGGVGPHVDSYDVFLLQVAGKRRWRIGRARDTTLRDDVPLKMLAGFEPEQEWLLEAGDMLYLPPLWAHDGEAVGAACMTCSIGFRAPCRDELARELMLRIADAGSEAGAPYRDPQQGASATPGMIPESLRAFAADAVARALRNPHTVDGALGAWLSEPKPQTWFDAGAPVSAGQGVRLDRRSRMMYDVSRVYLNGESYRPRAGDAKRLRRLADRRRLAASEVAKLGDDVREQIERWAQAGWLHGCADDEEEQT